MNMAVSQSLSGTAYSSPTYTPVNDPQDPATLAAAAQAAATVEAGGLTDVQLRELAAQLQATNAGLTSLNGELGATAISLPTVAASTDMGALSTADLLQLIRAEVAKTTALLVTATAEAITAQQATIAAKGEENKAANDKMDADKAEADRKAEKMKALSLAMKIFGGLATALGVLIAVVSGGTLAVVIAVALAAMYVTMTCMTEIKNDKGETGMDLMGKSCAKTLQRYADPPMSDEEAEKKGAAMAGYIMMGIQIALCVASIANGIHSAYTAYSAASTAATSATGATNSATTAATAAATTAAAEAAAKATAETVKAVAKTVAEAFKTVSAMTQGGLQVASGVMAIDVADAQYEATKAQAAVTELKALIKMLEKILETDAEFIQMLVQLLAQLDTFVAGIVADETASNQQTDLHSGGMA